jgi:hypothetical protein
MVDRQEPWTGLGVATGNDDNMLLLPDRSSGYRYRSQEIFVDNNEEISLWENNECLDIEKVSIE